MTELMDVAGTVLAETFIGTAIFMLPFQQQTEYLFPIPLRPIEAD
jgi:hypothetical protein